MKRHAITPEAMEAGRPNLNRGGTVSMVPPNIQPYQAAVGRGSAPGAGSKPQHEGWQKAIAVGAAVWFVGWFFLGYGLLWPLSLLLSVLSGGLGSTPLGGLFSWWERGMPAPDLYPAASELKIPSSQVARYVDSYVQSYGDAALIFAAHDGYAQLVNGLLLSRDLGYADLIDAADESGHTALLYAAGRGFQQVAAALLQAGADPDAPRQGKAGRGLTPLMEAAGTGHRELVTLLLRANATVDVHDEDGNTALMYAAYGGHLAALQELLQRGAMRDLANNQGSTALAMASARGHQAITDALQRGARPVVESQARRSRLQSLSRQGSGKSAPPEADAEEAKPVKATRVPEPKPRLVTVPPKAAGDGAADKKVKELEALLAELKRSQEAADLKTQRRIVELLEGSADKQKQLDEAEKERREAQQRADDLSAKLRQKEVQGLEDEQRQSRLSKEAHEARMEAERERSRAEAAEREAARRAEAEKHLKDAAQQSKADAGEHAAQVERLQAQLRELRAEVDRSEEERRALQRQLDRQRSGSAAVDAAGPAAPPVQEAAAPTPSPTPGGEAVDKTAVSSEGKDVAAGSAAPSLRPAAGQAAAAESV